MGLLGSIADTVADVGSAAADIAPIPGSDAVSGAIDAVQGAVGGSPDTLGHPSNGNGGNGSRPAPAPPIPSNQPGGQTQPTQQSQRSQGTPGITGGQQDDPFFSGGGQTSVGGTANLPGLPQVTGETQFGMSIGPPSGAQQGPGGQQGGGQQGGGQQAMQPSNFMQAIMADMLRDSVKGSNSKAILEAMQSGSLQGGIIQQPVEVTTPRGVEWHSRPGFRTVTLNGQKVSVFKPVAKALGLLPKGGRTFRQKADDAAREYLKMRRKWKGLAKKFGFKAPKSRKSGPSR